MDSRIIRIRRKLAKVPYAALRSHSFGEEKHRFRLEPPLPGMRVAEFEADHHIELPDPYRSFLTTLGGGGASPFYGLLPLRSCRLFTMDDQGEPGSSRGFTFVDRPPHRGDLFLHIIEAGCTDLVLLGITGPLTGRVVTGNADGFRGPDVSSATDFLAWYERWLDHLLAGRDNRDLELTSPALRAPVDRILRQHRDRTRKVHAS
ncbi:MULTISPECIES: SMI1/KNR4 family protein [unclassified Streptomyces]|uniref:SMI1/KNR4 family protein n=1 Tax=unclassified Streptomyces TaxID=2593676 RepID=UPI001660FF95|nr:MULTISPECIES: SMI1/KNR4 family protein [unclassified Streptomyces]MBD0710413.1 SMI1/KNR4 family protein [Streptomyces sp. CBMA291]MBD0712748.1 SMI1/KNR4 family protein [Streptomyces sp. CBMA370]